MVIEGETPEHRTEKWLRLSAKSNAPTKTEAAARVRERPCHAVAAERTASIDCHPREGEDLGTRR
ncbi:hypothetical protein KL86PLE_20190 [uncultured Pleomorphomonas sp.]|uniref:Uncharacterized protein n=1 Tax=uncultured Pleomorphomonas sp. TaxID=442121 RepID=A0A212LD77_9HYPH|nr:hypothetical protein KL86PLE_20190 [uncultured Pleomorphomonas sp.]